MEDVYTPLLFGKYTAQSNLSYQTCRPLPSQGYETLPSPVPFTLHRRNSTSRSRPHRKRQNKARIKTKTRRCVLNSWCPNSKLDLNWQNKAKADFHFFTAASKTSQIKKIHLMCEKSFQRMANFPLCYDAWYAHAVNIYGSEFSFIAHLK